MRVLIISKEVWRDDTNGGNVLSNIFEGTGYEFAQIYCMPGVPSNNLCKKYFQFTDSMMIKSFFNHQEVGEEVLLIDNKDNTSTPTKPNKKFYSFFHKHRWPIFYLIQQFLWNGSNWRNAKLDKFVRDFDPDIIFAPSYGDVFLNKLDRYVIDLCGKKAISYVSDDSYTLRQFNLFPSWWINRFMIRAQLRKTFPYYSLVYTMTTEQKLQCEKDFKANMKILLKAVDIKSLSPIKDIHSPIRCVYAGGIYLNRWKTLGKFVEAIKEINKDEVKITLDIYTGNEITSNINSTLNDGINSKIHGLVSKDELNKIYADSDIALHVESFDLENLLGTRMSFSTKIVDCLASSCAVMAICDDRQGGYVYLKENDAAICISKLDDIKDTLNKIVNNKEIIQEYKYKARQCCINSLDKNKELEMIMKDFETYGK